MNRVINLIKVIGAFAIALTLFTGCDDEDFTGHSRLKPTSPIITIVAPTAAELNDPEGYLYEIDLNMSVAQIVDVAVHMVHVDGDAELDTDYHFYYSNPITGADASGDKIIIPAGATSVKVYFEILSDELYDGDISLKLQVGDVRTANAKITPVELVVNRGE